MATRKRSKKANRNPAERNSGRRTDDSAHLEKVRSLLFGTQIKSQERRLEDFEKGIHKAILGLRSELQKRITALEEQVEHGMQAFEEQLRSDQDERSDREKEISRKITATASNLRKRIAKLDDERTRALRTLKQQVGQLAKELRSEAAASYQELWAEIESELEAMKSKKLDGQALAAVFSDLAKRVAK